MRWLALCVALVLCVALAPVLFWPGDAGAPGGGGPSPGCRVELSPANEASIVAMTNATRATMGLTRVRRDDAIGDAARSWSVRMASTGAFVHSNLSWRRGRGAGENIAQASSAAEAYQVMLDSPPHRANLLGRAWRFAGVGVARCEGTLFVTVNMMAAPGIRPLSG